MNALAEKYLMLLNKIGNNAVTHAEIEVTTEELANALYCSTRNAKMVVRKLVDEGLISWVAGRGRGNVSRLVFLAEKEPLLMEWAQDMSRKGDYKQAFELLKTYHSQSALIDRFVQWLNGHFGYAADLAGNSQAIDTLRFPVYRPIVTMDPADVYCAFDAHMVRQVFDQLLQYDYASRRVTPGVAHAWEMNADATEWTFHLRKGIRFHHGRELTADDVKFTLERIRGDQPVGWMTKDVILVECHDGRTLRIKLSRPNRIFHRYLSSAAMSIVPRDLVMKDESLFRERPVGSGPFRVVEWCNDRFEMVANPDYHQGRAHLDRIVIALMPEEAESMSLGAHWKQLLYDNTLHLKHPDPELMATYELSNGCMLMSWNLRKNGPQQSFAFRHAIDLLLNRKRFIRDLGGNRVYPAQGFRPTEQTPYLDEEHDEEEGIRLLRESGYDGTPITLSIFGSHETDAHWIERRFAEFGVSVVVRNDSKYKIGDLETMESADCILYEVVIASDDVCEIENYVQSGNFLKECLQDDMRLWAEGKVESALVCERSEDRTAILKEIEDRLREECHVLFILHKKLSTYVHPTVKGVQLNYLGWMDFKDIWLESRAMNSVE
ncbi:ABC transporter substrate-binding protein [Cohnella endophytica]|uniref:ABC transporter substrate-binding protein n=1 Tax=Cohnella endophytica TaxID=2419778 RepID=A0A494Y279_9BACL|nr:ABC transporter substrate-binding protein [Cohnella endophytica]RKP56857.1 ABC transporter substrate-binding protein [Cohnella endophytica]